MRAFDGNEVPESPSNGFSNLPKPPRSLLMFRKLVEALPYNLPHLGRYVPISRSAHIHPTDSARLAHESRSSV